MGKVNEFGILPKSNVIMGWAVGLEDPFYARVTRLTVIVCNEIVYNSWKEAWFLVDISMVVQGRLTEDFRLKEFFFLVP